MPVTQHHRFAPQVCLAFPVLALKELHAGNPSSWGKVTVEKRKERGVGWVGVLGLKTEDWD